MGRGSQKPPSASKLPWHHGLYTRPPGARSRKTRLVFGQHGTMFAKWPRRKGGGNHLRTDRGRCLGSLVKPVVGLRSQKEDDPHKSLASSRQSTHQKSTISVSPFRVASFRAEEEMPRNGLPRLACLGAGSHKRKEKRHETGRRPSKPVEWHARADCRVPLGRHHHHRRRRWCALVPGAMKQHNRVRARLWLRRPSPYVGREQLARDSAAVAQQPRCVPPTIFSPALPTAARGRSRRPVG